MYERERYPLSNIMFSGVYFLIKNGEIVYVGQSICVFRRIFDHLSAKVDFTHFSYVRCEKADLLSVERQYISLLRPRLNRTLSDAAPPLQGGKPFGLPYVTPEPQPPVEPPAYMAMPNHMVRTNKAAEELGMSVKDFEAVCDAGLGPKLCQMTPRIRSVRRHDLEAWKLKQEILNARAA